MFMPVIAVNIFVGVIINHICSADIFTVFIALSTLYILILFFFYIPIQEKGIQLVRKILFRMKNTRFSNYSSNTTPF